MQPVTFTTGAEIQAPYRAHTETWQYRVGGRVRSGVASDWRTVGATRDDPGHGLGQIRVAKHARRRPVRPIGVWRTGNTVGTRVDTFQYTQCDGKCVQYVGVWRRVGSTNASFRTYKK